MCGILFSVLYCIFETPIIKINIFLMTGGIKEVDFIGLTCVLGFLKVLHTLFCLGDEKREINIMFGYVRHNNN